eukprot:scaffold139780_cov20-Prasinocladus_malaysianus.AAC.1
MSLRVVLCHEQSLGVKHYCWATRAWQLMAFIGKRWIDVLNIVCCWPRHGVLSSAVRLPPWVRWNNKAGCLAGQSFV